MFLKFFYILRDSGVPVSPTALLSLHKALNMGLVCSIKEFYNAARTILVKNERYFDIYDQVFEHYFRGAELPDDSGFEIDAMAISLLDQWLQYPSELSSLLGIYQSELEKYTADELLDYFKKRLSDQEGEHHGGSKWIGTGGISPVGFSGYHPEGMRVGGWSGRKSAIKVAGERRYRDYSIYNKLSNVNMGEALKKLKNLVPSGVSSKVDVDLTISRLMRNGGEIELEFEKEIKDKLKVILMIDNGGWSMEPYVPLVRSLFYHARNVFKNVTTYYFHNTIYKNVWKDPERIKNKIPINDFSRFDPETRLVIIGDASMSPYELIAHNGVINISEKSYTPSIERLKQLRNFFPHSVWINPVFQDYWRYTETISIIGEIFPMFELSIDGLEKAVERLLK